MKSVKDTAALNALALKTGAKVTSDSGQTFNTEKKKAVPQKKLEPMVPMAPMPKPTVAPKPEKPDLGSVKVAETIVEVGRTNATMLEQIRDQISNIQMTSADPITRWEFEFIRDDKGYLTKLIADGAPEVKRLN